MKKDNDPIEREKAHATVADSFAGDETEPMLQVRAGDVWADFVRDSTEKREPETPRQNGAVPLLDDMTGIRQWE